MQNAAFPVVCALVLGLFAAAADASGPVELLAPGAPEGLVDDLRAASLSVAAKRDGVTNPQDLLAAARADYARLLAALYESGRYSGVIRISVDGREAADITPFSVPADIDRIVIRVTPGPLFAFGRTAVAPLAPETDLPAGFAPGAVARSALVGDAVARAIAGWRAQGNARARLAAQSLRADHRAATLDVDIALDPGPRLRFGRLVLSGDSAVRAARIHRIAGLPEGEVFSPEALADAARRLRQTGSFRSVSLREAETVSDDGALDITATLVDEKPRRFGLGAEVSTFEGLALTGFWLHRNFFGGAERLRFDTTIGGVGGETGGIDYGIKARLTRPATPVPDSAFFVTADASRLDEPDYVSDQIGFGIGLARRFTHHLNAELAVDLRRERVEEAGIISNYNLLSLPVRLTLDRRDTPLDATRGLYLNTELRPFQGLGSTASGVRLYADGRVYRGLGSARRFVLAGRAQVGVVSGPALVDAPPDFLFYSGGGGTVRGQSYQSLDIDLGGGRRRGGRSFLGLSAELRAAVRGRIGVVAFADGGYVGAGSFFDGAGGWHAGAGLGLRYETGVGPIRLDVALPIGGTSSGAQIYIGIGQAF